ncbi:hypothetical protein VIBNISOn1_1390023 [Vibrio nigripulchritudo SOn1]|uniref:Uncharacterized protein n=1 Tax=Vibrio nigripulchritudo SOn1 TaxID=1238450 RepID=A0AAV2VKZ0_9VIBR|nr:hypothetical protein VIBNISOn1_1390023 [Vibrio nigripulchritudo SOn1]
MADIVYDLCQVASLYEQVVDKGRGGMQWYVDLKKSVCALVIGLMTWCSRCG